MARSDVEVWVQLATRIPKALHREIKLYCVRREVSVMDFVTQAIQEKLAAPSSPEARPAKPSRRRHR
jgi:predicted HicB family RNase H-like nuclease